MVEKILNNEIIGSYLRKCRKYHKEFLEVLNEEY